MITPINIKVHASNPTLPIPEAVTFVTSPSAVFVHNVPPNCGRWAITAVSVAATYPDGSTTTRAAVQSANGVWVATLPATATSGRTANGLRILADGIDENGEAVTGYVLGVADFAVASLDVTPAPQPGETSYQMLYFDAVPSTLRKGDVAKVDGVLKLYNGTAWEPFAAPVTFDDAVTRTSANGVKSSGIWAAIWGALSALPTGFSSLYGWCVAQIAKLRDKLDLNVYSRGNALVTFPDGFSATYMDDTYVAPLGGETIEFYGPITSTAVPQYNFWVPYEYKDATDFDPQAQAVWCLFGDIGNSTPNSLVFRIGALYSIANWNTESPTLTLSYGEATGDAPTMARPLGATGDTLAKVSQMNTALAGKLDKSGDTMTGTLTMSGAAIYAYASGSQAPGGSIDGNGVMGNKLTTQNVSLSSLTFTINADQTYTVQLPLGSGTLALTANLRYALTTKTISNNAVTLDDRAINAVAVSSSLASLTINFPTATSGKARDFGLRLAVASGITTAPQIVLPQGVTCENADGEAPEIGADGAATILYFTETASGVFLVKGEVLQTITA